MPAKRRSPSIVHPPASRTEQEALVAATAAKAEARNTTRAHDADLARFFLWWSKDALPATAHDVALYITLHQDTHKPSTIRRWLASLSAAHRAANLPNPCREELVRSAMRGIESAYLERARREHFAPVRAVDPIDDEILRAIVEACDDSLAGLRDRALLLVGFAGALRRSELAAITKGALRFDVRGVRIGLGQTKGSRSHGGETVTVPRAKRDRRLCPVRALEAWLGRSGIVRGSVFRRIDRHGNLGSHALTGTAIALIVKRHVLRAGLDPSLFSGHSLRAGLITTAVKQGKPERRIRQHSRHRNGGAGLDVHRTRTGGPAGYRPHAG